MIRRILTWGLFGLLLVASTTACGGNDTTGGPAGPSGPTATGDPDDSEVTSATRAATSTTAPATTTTIPPYSFDGSVPPPELVNTGTDYVAIFKSLVGYGNWLKRHHPDVALVGEAYVEGSDIARRLGENLEVLAAQNLRDYDVDQRLEIEAVGVREGIATLKVREHVSSEQLIDSGGSVVDEAPINGVIEYVVLLSADAAGRWRIAAIDQVSTDPRVQL